MFFVLNDLKKQSVEKNNFTQFQNVIFPEYHDNFLLKVQRSNFIGTFRHHVSFSLDPGGSALAKLCHFPRGTQQVGPRHSLPNQLAGSVKVSQCGTEDLIRVLWALLCKPPVSVYEWWRRDRGGMAEGWSMG